MQVFIFFSFPAGLWLHWTQQRLHLMHHNWSPWRTDAQVFRWLFTTKATLRCWKRLADNYFIVHRGSTLMVPTSWFWPHGSNLMVSTSWFWPHGPNPILQTTTTAALYLQGRCSQPTLVLGAGYSAEAVRRDEARQNINSRVPFEFVCNLVPWQILVALIGNAAKDVKIRFLLFDFW